MRRYDIRRDQRRKCPQCKRLMSNVRLGVRTTPEFKVERILACGPCRSKRGYIVEEFVRTAPEVLDGGSATDPRWGQ